MTLPGTTVISRDNPPASGAPVDSGTLFVAGLSEQGSESEPVLVRNLSQFVAKFGDRVSYGVLYDVLDVFFREGGQRAYVARVVGPSAAKAAVNLSDGVDDTLTATAKGSGDWYDDVDVVVAAGVGAGTFTLEILDGSGNQLEKSPDLADNAAALAWAVGSDYITLTDLGAGDPEVGSNSLTGGDDDRGNITDTEWQTALGLFTKDLGPGQIAAPGRTTTQGHTELLAHAAERNRAALLDLADSSDAATLAAAGISARGLANARYGAVFAPWAVIPGLSLGTTRTVPYSAVQAGLIARAESRGASPNEPAAGELGVSRYATSLSQEAWSDADRETLNDAGVNVARFFNGSVRTYGYRTPVDPVTAPTWLQFSNARLAMVIAQKADSIAERFLFTQLDGRGKKIAEFGGELIGMLLPYWSDGSLYGDTAEEAFSVDVGDQVNTPQTIANQELRAVIGLKMSPFAEQVVIEIAKVANTEAL